MRVDKNTTNENRRFQKIDKSFLKNIRLSVPMLNFSNIQIDNDIIVPQKLTHTYLKGNFKINESILKHYFAQTQYLISESEYKELFNIGLMCKKWKVLEPYSILIGNAYYSRTDLLAKLSHINSDNYNLICEGKKVEYLTDLTPYFKEYSNGFKHGFNDFDKECIEPFLVMFPNKKDYLNKVFEFITKEIPFTHGWATYEVGFTTNYNIDTNKHVLTGGFENGKKQGYFYKAWSIIFSNHNLFTPLFKEFKSTRTTQETLPPKESDILSKLITHQNSIEIVEKIKIQYKNIKGKSLKLLLKALQDLDLLPKERIASKFYKACKNEFNWSIASYNAMNGYKYNDVTDKEELEQKISYLKSIIETK